MHHGRKPRTSRLNERIRDVAMTIPSRSTPVRSRVHAEMRPGTRHALPVRAARSRGRETDMVPNNHADAKVAGAEHELDLVHRTLFENVRRLGDVLARVAARLESEGVEARVNSL